MAKGFKTCKICGKQYEYCKTNRPTGTFYWRDVACCEEHGAEYFRQVLEARRKSEPEPVAVEIPIDEGFDALFEGDFDDGEEELAIEK